jgi:uncharacterized membrane protein
MGFIGDIMPFEVLGLDLLLLLVLIMATGILASNYLGNKLFSLVDKLFQKVPVVKMLYSALKDMIEAFAGDKKSFDKPVLVELLENGPKAMGFITRESADFLGIQDHVAVYMPQSYNFAGQVLLFPASSVTPINLGSGEVMATIVSGGVSGEK